MSGHFVYDAYEDNVETYKRAIQNKEAMERLLDNKDFKHLFIDNYLNTFCLSNFKISVNQVYDSKSRDIALKTAEAAIYFEKYMEMLLTPPNAPVAPKQEDLMEDNDGY